MEADILDELKLFSMMNFYDPRPRMTIEKAIEEIIHLRKLKKVVLEPTPLEMSYSARLDQLKQIAEEKR